MSNKVAHALASMLKRPADVAARYGGEEFAAVLPDTSSDQAWVVANAIREHVASLALEHAPAAVVQPYVTLSIGVASYALGRLVEPELIEAADRALYASKRSGRNQVTLEAKLPLADRT